MRYGNPPNLDAEPLMTLKQIANEIGVKLYQTVSSELNKFHAENRIEKRK